MKANKRSMLRRYLGFVIGMAVLLGIGWYINSQIQSSLNEPERKRLQEQFFGIKPNDVEKIRIALEKGTYYPLNEVRTATSAIITERGKIAEFLEATSDWTPYQPMHPVFVKTYNVSIDLVDGKSVRLDFAFMQGTAKAFIYSDFGELESYQTYVFMKALHL